MSYQNRELRYYEKLYKEQPIEKAKLYLPNDIVLKEFTSVDTLVKYYDKVTCILGNINCNSLFRDGFKIYVLEHHNEGTTYRIDIFTSESEAKYNMWNVTIRNKDSFDKFKYSQELYNEAGLRESLRTKVLSIIDYKWDIEDFVEFLNFWDSEENLDA